MTIQRILVPTDFGAAATAALAYARDLAKVTHAGIYLLHVTDDLAAHFAEFPYARFSETQTELVKAAEAQLAPIARDIEADGSPAHYAVLTSSATATAIVGYDLHFYEQMGKLSPNPNARESWAQRPPAEIEEAAFRNASLQGGYFMMAARAIGLDCGPMGGFDHEGVDKAFFSGTAIKSNFLCNLGFGDPAGLRPRAGRLDFDEACRIL